MEVEEVETYGDLLRILQTLSPDQLAMPAQVVKGQFDQDEVHEACPLVCVGSVNKLGLRYVRSVKDNRRNGDEIIIYIDSNPFAEDGAIAHEMTDAMDWDNTIPIYPKDYSPDQNWTGLAQKLVDETTEETPDGSIRSNT
jgi:hypothetical protein